MAVTILNKKKDDNKSSFLIFVVFNHSDYL